VSIFIHADLDAFYASCEQLEHPEYRGKPVIVGGLPTDRRAVVSTCSYEARKFGVHAAMPTAQAYKLCPGGIYVHGDMHHYFEKSNEVMAVFKNYSPDVQQISIDEAFIDITGTEKLFGPPRTTAQKIKDDVRNITGLTVSIGMASNKYIAKIASGMSKPDGLFIVEAGREEDFMCSLKVDKIWGAGKKSQEIFAKHNIKTCKELHDFSLEQLNTIFGDKFSVFLYNAVRGEAAADFDRERVSHSISAERTFSYNIYNEFDIESSLMYLSQILMFRLIREKVRTKTAAIKIRYGNFKTESAQYTGTHFINSINEMYETLVKLFYKKYN
jgi:DNA polymerase-4